VKFEKEKRMKIPSLQIHQGLHPAQLQRAAQFYFETFRQQINPILGAEARAIAFLCQAINPQCALTAQHEGEMVGLAGLRYDGQQFLQLHLPLFTRHFGWLLGRIRFCQAALFERPIPPGQLCLDNLTVAPAMRGQGVGTWLINAVVEFASQKGFEAVCIQVPNTAPAFYHLCRRLGFNYTETQSWPALSPFGITTFTTLTKTV
jgi:predicted N-acetyltransferase YhbS